MFENLGRAGRGPRSLPDAHVPRPRLVSSLDERARVTLVCAPAGFGKSTLVREWLDHTSEPHLYYAFAPNDESAARMWASLVRELRSIDPRRSDALLSMFAASTLDDAHLVSEFVDEVACVDGLVVVLEDLHNIASPELCGHVRMLVEKLGDGARLILTSRQRPNLPLALLHSRGELIEIGAAELRLTLEEVQELAARTEPAAPGLGPDELLDSTDGWPAGIGLLLRGSPRARPGSSARDWSATSDVAELLRSQVLDQLPEHQQVFLTRIAFLEAWSPGLCDRVAGIDDGDAILRDLAASETFILRGDEGDDGWYRPHQMLGDLLRADFERLPEDERRALRSRASEWYEEHGFVVEAVEQAMAAGDEERGVDLVLTRPFALADVGQQQLVKRVLRLPAAELTNDPERMLQIAAALGVTGQGGATLRALDAIEQREGDGDERSEVRGRAAVLRCLVSSWAGDLLTAERADGDVLRHLGHLPDDEVALRARLNLARCLRLAGRLDDAERALRELMAPTDDDETTPSIFARASWSQLLLDRGELERARDQADIALDRWGQREMEPVVGMTDALRTLAFHAREIGDLELANEMQRTAVRASGSIRPGLGRALVMVDVARAAAEAGDIAAADDALGDIRSWWRDFPPGPQLLHAVHLGEFDVALAAGDPALASTTAARVEDLDHAIIWPAGPLLRARLRLATGEPGPPDLSGSTISASAPLPQRIEVLLVLADLAAAAGDDERSAACASRALEIGLPAGYRRSLARSESVRRLREDQLPPTLLPAFRAVLSSTVPAGLPGRPDFTERELDVLRLLPTHLSYSGIAAELFISINTAKFHVKNLYAKLEVGDRDAAVQRARQLGLLE